MRLSADRADCRTRIRPRPRPALALLALALLAAALAPLGSAHANVNPQRELPHEQATPFAALLGSRGIRSSNLAAFPKWTRVLDRHAGAGRQADKPCTPIGPDRCIGGEDWKRLLASLEGKDKRAQVEEVSRYVNQATYIPDRLNYGKKDYWALPSELFARGGGGDKLPPLRWCIFTPPKWRTFTPSLTKLNLSKC